MFLGLLSPPNPFFSGICKVGTFYQIWVWNDEILTFDAQGLKIIIIVVHVGVVKKYVTIMKALREKKR
jgi:hypothetical protein